MMIALAMITNVRDLNADRPTDRPTDRDATRCNEACQQAPENGKFKSFTEKQGHDERSPRLHCPDADGAGKNVQQGLQVTPVLFIACLISRLFN